MLLPNIEEWQPQRLETKPPSSVPYYPESWSH